MKSKILIISQSLEQGGMQRAAVNLAENLSSEGYSIEFYLLFQERRFFKFDDSIKVHESPFDFRRFNKFVYAFLLFFKLRRVVKYGNYSCYFAFGEYFNPFVLLCTIGINTRKVLCNRMSPMMNLGKFNEITTKLFYPKADYIIVQSNYAKNKLLDVVNNDKIKVINNFITSIPIKERVKENVIICLGRLSKEKGQDLLIDAFSKIQNKGNWKIQIIGEGPQEQFLKSKVSENKLNERILFKGALNHFEDELNSSKILVLPSRFEGFPNALIEGMSVGLACISSNCISPLVDFFNHEVNGLFFENGDSNDLSLQLEKLMFDEKLQIKLGNNAREITHILDNQITVKQYINIIESNI